MKKSRLLFLCAVLTAAALFAVGCGNNGDMNGTEAPYEDETNRKVNESQNGTTNNGSTNNGSTNNGSSNNGMSDNGTSDSHTDNNGAVEGDLQRSGDSLRDAGRNLLDSVEETGDALRNGIDNFGNDMNNTNDANNTNNMGNADNANSADHAGGTNTNR